MIEHRSAAKPRGWKKQERCGETSQVLKNAKISSIELVASRRRTGSALSFLVAGIYYLQAGQRLSGTASIISDALLQESNMARRASSRSLLLRFSRPAMIFRRLPI